MRGTSSLCRATRGADSLPWVLLMPDKPCLARGLCRAAALPGSAGCPPGRVSAASRSAAFLFSQGPGFAKAPAFGLCTETLLLNLVVDWDDFVPR